MKKDVEIERIVEKKAKEYADEYYFEHTEIAAESFKQGYLRAVKEISDNPDAIFRHGIYPRNRTIIMYRGDE